MDVFAWLRGKRQPRSNEFRVVSTLGIIEYLGILPYGYPATHRLVCCRIDRAIDSALLDQGFALAAGEGAATHLVWCVCSLPRDKSAVRLVFSMALCLRSIPVSWQRDWLAGQVAKGLARSLIESTDPCFLIPCNTKTEFPWCRGVDRATLRDYWLTEIGAHYRLVLKRMGSTIGV